MAALFENLRPEHGGNGCRDERQGDDRYQQRLHEWAAYLLDAKNVGPEKLRFSVHLQVGCWK